MAKLGQIKSGTMRVGNTTASGYGIVYADEIIGHRRVNTYADLANIPDWSLYNKAGGETTSAAIGQLWYVTTGDDSGHSAGLYQLTAWSDNTKTWKFFKNGADVSIPDTTYKFENGSNGTFNVTLPGGTVQSVSIGKPENAQHADLADGATRAATAVVADSATKATQDEKGNNIVNTYATKSDVQALSHALIYKGTIGTNGTITSLNVPAQVGDVYVAVAGAPAVNGVALEAGDMIIAKTAGDGTTTHATWTAVQTNINGAVTTTDTLTGSKLIVGGGNRTIKTATGTGFVKMLNGVVSTDNSTYATTTALSNKVDKVDGKGLSTNDFTAVYKNKLDDLGLSGDSFNNASTNTKGLRLNLVGTDSSYDIPIVKPSTDASTYGLMSGADKKKLDDLQNYTLSVATTNKLGGIEIGFAKNDAAKNYPVELSGNKAYVHVPWVNTNTDTTYTADGTYVTLTGTQFSLAHNKKTLIDNAIQPGNIETEDGILTYDKFGYLYHQITKDFGNKYVCKELVKSYVTVNIVTGKTVNAGSPSTSGPLVFCNNGTATTDGTIRGSFGQQKSITDTSVYGNDVTWALNDSSNVIVIDQNGKEYTITPKGSNDYCVLTPRAIQSTEITRLFN